MSFKTIQSPIRPSLLLGRAFVLLSTMLLLACGGGSAPPPAPVITSFLAAKPLITRGTSTTLSGVFTNGTGVVDQSIGTVSSGTPATVSPTADTTYTLTVTNSAGVKVTATASVAVVAPPTISLITAPAIVTAGQAGCTASVPTQAGCTYAWTITNGTITSGATTTAITYTPGAAGTVELSCVVTNVAGTSSAPGTVKVAIVAVPAVPLLTVPAYTTAGGVGYTARVASPQEGCTYAWTLSNGTITTGAGATALTFTSGSVGTMAFTCIATNQAGTVSAAAAASSTVVAFPAVISFSSSPTEVAAGGASTLSCAYTGGTGVISPGPLPIASSGSVVVRPDVTTEYTLVVTNLAGEITRATCTVGVVPSPTISLFQAASTSPSVGQGTLLTFSFDGSGVLDNGIGPVLSGGQVTVFPTREITPYTLTVTNSVGISASQTVTLNLKVFTSKFVYVANAGGGVSGFSLNDATGELVELAGSPWDDSVAALHVTSDPSGKFLFVVNGDGVVSTNTLRVYKVNAASGELTLVSVYDTGTNPWATAVDPSGKYVYVRCESGISAFTLNRTTGALTAKAGVTTSKGTGGILIHPSGTLLFTVGRDSASLQVFNLDPATGALSPNGSYGLTAGNGPLALALSHAGDYLITKSEGAAGGDPQDCIVYVYHLDLQTGALVGPMTMDTGLQQADSYHGVSASPVLPVVYITLATSTNDFAAYTMNLQTGALTPLWGVTYDLFNGTGADNLAISRNGKWGIITNFQSGNIAVCSVDPVTGALTPAPVFYASGSFPVAVTVLGTLAEADQ